MATRSLLAGSLARLGLPLLALLALGAVAFDDASAAQPIVTDSRIKTFVYNANEVFAVTTEYGYQANIEFGDNESIDTVSVGDRVSWQIIPAGRRLFIRAMEENAHTNMTVVTNKRAYQFDLRSSTVEATIGSEELVYVVRFYYPTEQDGMNAPASYGGPMMAPPPLPASYVSPMPPMQTMGQPMNAPMMNAAPQMPVSTGSLPPPAMAYAPEAMNYRYTYSGPSGIAPVKIYDDGKTTYFKFRGNAAPNFSVISATGEQLPVPTHSAGPGVVAVDMIAPRFSLQQGGQQVVVYNESNGA